MCKYTVEIPETAVSGVEARVVLTSDGCFATIESATVSGNSFDTVSLETSETPPPGKSFFALVKFEAGDERIATYRLMLVSADMGTSWERITKLVGNNPMNLRIGHWNFDPLNGALNDNCGTCIPRNWHELYELAICQGSDVHTWHYALEMAIGGLMQTRAEKIPSAHWQSMLLLKIFNHALEQKRRLERWEGVGSSLHELLLNAILRHGDEGDDSWLLGLLGEKGLAKGVAQKLVRLFHDLLELLARANPDLKIPDDDSYLYPNRR